MERVEGARAAVVQLTEERDALASERDTLAASVHEQLSAIDAERRMVVEQRGVVGPSAALVVRSARRTR